MTGTATLGYKLIKRVKAEAFDVESLPNYILCIQVGVIDLQVCVIDRQSSRCLLIEDYRFENVKTVNNRLEVVKSIFSKHPFLMVTIWGTVKLSMKTHKFSLVPQSLFIPEYASDYLTMNAEIRPEMEEVYYYRHISSDAVNVFAADKKMSQWIMGVYPAKKVQIICQSSAWIEGILKYDDHSHEKTMFCLVDKGVLHIVVTQKQKLLYYNQFAGRKGEDFLKYILLVFQELKLNTKKSKVIFWGFLTNNSEQIQHLKKYLHGLSFGTKPAFTRFGEQFSEVTEHQYFDVYSIFLCE